MIFARNFNAQLGCLIEAGKNIDGPLSVFADLTDNNGRRLLQVCSHRTLFLVETRTFIIKNNIGSPGTLLLSHSLGLKLTMLRLVTGGVDQSNIDDHFSLHMFTGIMLRPVLPFVCI